MGNDGEGLRGRVTRQSEEAIGKLAQELLESPVVSGALSRAFETRERAMRAQEVAMGALNLPSASDLERLTRRVRSVSQRLEGIEDGLDRLEDRLQRSASAGSLEDRLSGIEATLERLEAAQAAKPKRAPAKRAPAKRAPAKRAPAKRSASGGSASRGGGTSGSGNSSSASG
jgi:DNA repair exonuclease SbcCD ATPase subunit